MRLAAFLILLVVVLRPGGTPARTFAGIEGRTPNEEVTVHGWVEDARRVLLLDLNPGDFEVAIDDATVPVQGVAPRGASMSIIVLLDTSRSVHWPTRPLDQQLADFIGTLKPDDRVMVATCCARTTFGPFRPAREDARDDLRAALDIDDDEGFAGSPIWDAMHEAITILSRQPPPRALIVMSDGRSSGNRHGLGDVADHAMAGGVSVNIIAKHSAQHLYQAGNTVAIVQPTAPLESLTRYTGGMLFTYPERRDEGAKTMFGVAASVLRSLHAFRFAPPVNDGKPHRLEIRSKTAGVTVHAPTAFRAD